MSDNAYAYMAWVIGVIALCALAAVGAWFTKSAWCLWVMILIPSLSHKSKEGGEK